MIRQQEIHCHDCGCREGKLHEYGCDMERCPFCGNQLITCDCCYIELGFKYDYSLPMAGLPKDIYEKGLPDNLEQKWHEILEGKGRIPYIQWPVICAKCGILNPEFFYVPDDEWAHYIQINKRQEVVCMECYIFIKNKIEQPNKGGETQ